MPGDFGEDSHVGTYMLQNRNGCVDPFKPLSKTLNRNSIIEPTTVLYSTTDIPKAMSTGGHFEMLLDNFTKPENTKRLEFCSAVLSFICLVGSIALFAQKYPIHVSLSRNVDFISRDPKAMEYMRLWHYAADESCHYASNKKDFEVQLLKTPWGSDDKPFDGLVVEASVKVSEIELCFIAFFIYLFSTSFQAFRWAYFTDYCNPESGPEFSRWLEYALTSPLQVLLVALAFRITNIDVLLGYFGMQLALVIMGYDIEKQIHKQYKRSISVADVPKKNRFYHVLHAWGVPDIRGFVYLLVCWTLHLLIWGIPGLWHSDFIRWGISGDYAYAHKYQKACFHDEEFQMPAAVDVIFWSQYILFTVFGVVCSAQFVLAFVRPLPRNERSEDATGKTAMQKRWRTVSMWYAILSVSAKTLLEVGFLMLLINGEEWLEFARVPKDLVSRYPDITYWQNRANKTSFGLISENTTCFSMALGPSIL